MVNSTWALLSSIAFHGNMIGHEFIGRTRYTLTESCYYAISLMYGFLSNPFSLPGKHWDAFTIPGMLGEPALNRYLDIWIQSSASLPLNSSTATLFTHPTYIIILAPTNKRSGYNPTNSFQKSQHKYKAKSSWRLQCLQDLNHTHTQSTTLIPNRRIRRNRS